MNKIRSQKGYTLVEVLVVLVIIVTVGTIMGNILISTLRGSNKSSATTTVRQNGDYANYIMTQMLKNAQSIQSFGNIPFTSQNCSQPITSGTSPTPTPGAYKASSITINSYDGGQTTFSCTTTANTGQIPTTAVGVYTIASISASNVSVPSYLLDPTKVTITGNGADCYFTCSQTSLTTPPIIGIYFTLTQSGIASPDTSAVIPFQTSVTLSNVGQ
jgi:prepilin-type N-terminal cleavage/methylation domain-containing protein